MLVVSRRINERIAIRVGKTLVLVQVCESSKKGKVVLGVDAPPDVEVDRFEVYERKRREREDAAVALALDPAPDGDPGDLCESPGLIGSERESGLKPELDNLAITWSRGHGFISPGGWSAVVNGVRAASNLPTLGECLLVAAGVSGVDLDSHIVSEEFQT
jgi:carbon storage regulator CsrA